MTNNNLIVLVCVGLGVAAFGTVFVAMPDNKSNAPPVVFPAANPVNVPVGLPKLEVPKTPDPVWEDPIKNEPAPPVQRASYRTWKLPAPENLKRTDADSYHVKELTISDDGTHVLAKSKLDVHCLNVVSGRLAQTFKPAKPRWDYQKPETNFTFLAPDASCVMIASESQTVDSKKRKIDTKEIVVYSATNGNVLGRSTLDERSDIYRFHESAVFSPRGDYLLLPTFHYRDGLLMQAVVSRSGAVRTIDVPGKSNARDGWQLTLAVPQEPTLLVYRHGGTKDNPGGVSALDLRKGTEKPILSLTVDPWNLFNRGVQLSPDGNLVLSQGLRALQVCDWRADKRLLDLKIGELQDYHNGRFTPDGQRVLVQWTPHYQIIRIGGPSGNTDKVANRVYLYDIASQTKIAQFTPEDHGLPKEMNALAISRDGKTLVWAHETTVFAIDFQAAFGIDPLPPAHSTGPDVLPDVLPYVLPLK